MCDLLIRRFRERILREPTVDYSQLPPIRPRPPVTAERLARAEARLGFPLPPLLRGLYTQVGDGGYGPGRGLFHLIGGDWSLVAHAEETCLSIREDEVDPWWPPRLVEILNWGGHDTSAVDCSGPPYPVFLYNSAKTDGDAPREDYIEPQADSLEDWLSAWLDGEDLWEQYATRSG